MAKVTKKQKEFLNHELLDRSYIAFDTFDRFVIGHPSLKTHKELKKDAEEIQDKLFKFYQKIGSKII